ncbi:MAG: GIY-YIG nuclease family protein, partial [Chloroflexota bacterium]
TVAGFGYIPKFLEQLLGARWPAVDLLRLVHLHGFRGRPDPITLAKHFGLTPPHSRRPGPMLNFSAGLLEQLQASHSIAELCVLGEPRSGAIPTYQGVAEEPGVYVMASAQGEPLYVGKSVNLKRRVSSYLRSPIAISRNLQDLMELTERIDVVPVDSELEAVLLEKKLIAEWLPPFNTQRRWGERGQYLRLSTHEPFPRLTHAGEPQADGATYFGPFRHATAAMRLRTLLASILRLRTCARQLPSSRKARPACAKAASAECLAPCIVGPPPAPYSAEVDLAKELLSAAPGEFRERLRRLIRERPPHVQEAPRLKRQLEALASSGSAAADLSLWE